MAWLLMLADSLSAFDLPEIEVVAEKPAAWVERARNLGELGLSSPWVFVRDYGGLITLGGDGLGPKHSEVYIFGVPASSPALGQADLSLLLPRVFAGARVETRGMSGVWLSRPGGRGPWLGMGSWGYRDIGFAGKGWAVEGEAFSGNYPYSDRFGQVHVRENSDWQRVAGGLLVGDLGGYFSVWEGGCPGPVGSVSRARLVKALGVVRVGRWWASGFGTSYQGSEIASGRLGWDQGPFYPRLEWVRSREMGTRLRPDLALVWEGRAGRAGLRLVGPWIFPLADLGGAFGPLWLSGHLWGAPPSLNDLYWPRDAYAEGNPRLRPERGLGGQAGLRTGRLEVRASASVVWDQIIWVFGERWRPTNLGRVVRLGLGGKLDLGWIKTSLWREASPLPYVPSLSAHLRLGANPWVGLDYIGPRRTRPSGGRVLPGVPLVSAGIGGTFGGWRVEVSGTNLLNISWEAVEGYPLPGRELRIFLRKEVFK